MYQLHSRANKFILVTWVVTSLFLWACKTIPTTEQRIESAKKLATEKLGSDLESYPNSSGEFILFIQKTNPTAAHNFIKLIVIQVKDNTIVLEQSFNPGYAKWITDSSIEVLSVPGTMRENESLSDYKKIINLRTPKP